MSAVLAAAPRRERRMTTQELVAELEWLFEGNMHPELAAQQLRMRPSSLRRRLERAGYSELARRFDRPEWWEVSR